MDEHKSTLQIPRNLKVSCHDIQTVIRHRYIEGYGALMFSTCGNISDCECLRQCPTNLICVCVCVCEYMYINLMYIYILYITTIFSTPRKKNTKITYKNQPL
jgi:hypothetical protein